MKNLLRQISLLFVLNLVVLNVNGQCHFPDTIPTYPPGADNTYASWNGWFLPVHGTLRILIVFAEIDYDIGTDPNPDSTEGWPVHSLPNWADDLLDPNIPTGQPQGLMTRYYNEASSGLYNVIGDYLLAPTNGGIFKVLMSDIDSYGYKTALCTTIDQTMNGEFITGNGLNNISNFDIWTEANYGGLTKETPSTDNPQSYDHVMFIWRNHVGLDGEGHAYYWINNTILGYPIDTYSYFGTFDELPINIMRHEYAHLMYGGNNFHTAGG